MPQPGCSSDGVIHGGGGADNLRGGKGDDFIDGLDGVGQDSLGGGEGDDECKGERDDTKLNCET